MPGIEPAGPVDSTTMGTAKYHAIIVYIALRAAGGEKRRIPRVLERFQKVVRHNSPNYGGQSGFWPAQRNPWVFAPRQKCSTILSGVFIPGFYLGKFPRCTTQVGCRLRKYLANQGFGRSCERCPVLQ